MHFPQKNLDMEFLSLKEVLDEEFFILKQIARRRQ